MICRQSLFIVAVTFVVFSGAARAQSLNVKPGLWEVTATTTSSGMPPMDLSGLPPAQRAKIEAAMKKQMEQTKPTVTRECMTKEKIERGVFQDKDLDASCKRTTIAKTPTLQELKVECTGSQKMTGTMRFEAPTPESVSGTVTMIAGGGGQTMNASSTFTAKWIGANCGDVK